MQTAFCGKLHSLFFFYDGYHVFPAKKKTAGSRAPRVLRNLVLVVLLVVLVSSNFHASGHVFAIVRIRNPRLRLNFFRFSLNIRSFHFSKRKG